MADTPGTPPAISLPQGGGALRGIGETFCPDLFSGTGNLSIPLNVPSGRNGFTPQLKLDYSTGNGNGPFGLGWASPAAGVSRKTSKGVPRYRDDRLPDVFVLSGFEDLVPVTGAPAGAQRYRPRTEGNFALIDRDRSAGNDCWRVKSRDGLGSLYGTEAAAGRDPAAIANPDDPGKVFAWKLSKTEDAFGNRIEYAYRRDRGSAGTRRWDQLYLDRISYADFTTAAGATSFLVSVSFEYDDRPDEFSDYRAGFEIRTRLRCKRIVVRTHAGPARVHRAYELLYLDERTDLARPALLPLNGISLLSQIQVVGYDDQGQASRELPPIEFGYSRFEPLTRSFFPVSSAEPVLPSLTNADFELVDLFGSGLPDILEMSGTVRCWRNLGGGRFDRPHFLNRAPAGVRLADAGVQLIDANGDGRSDVLVTKDTAGYYALNLRADSEVQRFQTFREAPSFSLEDPEVRLVDLDGDGVTDAIRSGTRMECFFNDPGIGWRSDPEHRRFVERRSLEEFPNVSFSDPRVKWADMSGDNLQDIVMVHDGNVEYWPNLGHGNWGPRRSMRNAPRFLSTTDPRRILLGDVDGDGLADLVWVDHRKTTVWINRGGQSWSDPISIPGTPALADADDVRLIDLLGSGVSGVLWSGELAADGRPSCFFLDLAGGTKPYLLTEMDNHLGARTTVTYASSTKFFLADEATRDARWRTPLPFPVHVVERVEVNDAISGGALTTEYRYHHGYWDGAEREFRGFGLVEVLTAENLRGYAGRLLPRASVRAARVPAPAAAFSPPLLSRTWFHLGPVSDERESWYEPDFSHEYWPGDLPLLGHRHGIDAYLASLQTRRERRDALRALRGQVLRTELYALDAGPLEDRPYTISESAYALRDIAPSTLEDTNGPRIYFPHLIASRTTQWERGDDPMTTVQYTSDYDDFGQPCRSVAVGCPRGWRRMTDAVTSTFLATDTETVYAVPVDPNVYIRTRVAQTTTYEVVNPAGVARTLAEVISRAATRVVIAQTLTFYDDDPNVAGFGAFTGRAFGQVGKYGAVARTDALVLTDNIRADIYGAGTPAYLSPGVAAAANAEYPAAFLNQLPSLAGFIHEPGGPNSPYVAGYFARTGTRYDFHSAGGRGRGLVLAQRDALAHDTSFAYDQPYQLLQTAVTDPGQLRTQVAYDYRVMLPCRVTEPNGNVSEVAFSPVGLVTELWSRGQGPKNEGDRQQPNTRFTYGLRAYYESLRDGSAVPRPIYAESIRRVFHDADPDDTGETIEARQYSDGFGRLFQTRSRAEDTVFDVPATGRIIGRTNTTPDVNVVVSGWTVFDNKGRVVELYEPFLSTGWDVNPESDSRQGVFAAMRYDPRGQCIRTIAPDGSEHHAIYGIPRDLADPFRPDGIRTTPWESYTYDSNDNAGRTHAGDAMAAAYRHHWNTPASIEIDALGRTIRSVVRNREWPSRAVAPPTAVEEHVTRSAYDIRGNLLTLTDPVGRVAFTYSYDLRNRALRTDALDSGTTTVVLDAGGNTREVRHATGALKLSAYDRLNRPVALWARDDGADRVTLREKSIYGDSPNVATPAALNLLGRLHKHYDEAGLLTITEYDFKGNILDSTREVVSDAFMLSDIQAHTGASWNLTAPRVDWTLQESQLLDSARYRTVQSFDALDRVKSANYPDCANGDRYRLRPRYNSAGALEQVQLEGPLDAAGNGVATTYVEQIAYDAKGRRSFIAFGNRLMTRYRYHPRSLRLETLRTERYSRAAQHTFQPSGNPLQDLAYSYDLAGNLVRLEDRTPGCGVNGNVTAAAEADPAFRQLLMAGDALVRAFEYDPLYRLTAATGRACADIPVPRPWHDRQACGYGGGNHGPPTHGNAANLASLYREDFEYDAAGNVLSMRQRQLVQAAGGARWDTVWSRENGMGGMAPDVWRTAAAAHLGTQWPTPPSNCLTHVDDRVPGVTAAVPPARTHAYDAGGSLVREGSNRFFEWDHSGRMKSYRTQAAASEPGTYALYLYDSAGRRLKKLVRTSGGDIETTIYIGETFEHHRRTSGGATVANNQLLIMDGDRRIASVRSGNPLPGDGTAAHPVKYYLLDHLGSSAIVVSLDGTWINREECFAFGETSFGSYGRKRFRFTGKERDEESGLAYHGARYYAPYLARWTACDPMGPIDGLNVFTYVKNNPIRHVDQNGQQVGGSAEAPMPAGGPPEASLSAAPPPPPDKTRVCLDPRDSKGEATRKMRLWSAASAIYGATANLKPETESLDVFYEQHKKIFSDALNDTYQKVCGERPFAPVLAGTYSKKSGVHVSSDVTDPLEKFAVTAHEVFHQQATDYLDALSREDAGKILDPDKYDVKKYRTDGLLPKKLDVDIRRCEEFLAYEITVDVLMSGMSEGDRADLKGVMALNPPVPTDGAAANPKGLQDPMFAHKVCHKLIPIRARISGGPSLDTLKLEYQVDIPVTQPIKPR